jgi:eukaryotic-like serine/threonine-protein kinase
VSIPLGQFVLDDIVGSGGAGVVWRGRHARLGLPVAVKVLPPRADRHALHAHKNELQAVARLHHPHVVSLLDAGLIDARALASSDAAGHELVEGSPWLAMELASGGDLSAWSPPFSWPVVTDLLRALLSALAHAHARGVVHKDLKPQNVLVCSASDLRPGIKLTDFGLAQSEVSEHLAGGTPLYMAPEQFDGEGSDLGPWTDLYALGCLATWLATGSPPFGGGGWTELARKHAKERAPALSDGPGGAIDAPSGFGAWVARLLEKDPAMRFRCAADADLALARLDPERPAPPVDRLTDGLVAERKRPRAHAEAATVRKVDDERTELLPPRAPRGGAAPVLDGSLEPLERIERAERSEGIERLEPSDRPEGEATGPSDVSMAPSPSQSQPPPLEVGAAPPPPSWRLPPAPLPDLRLVDAGLSLWGMRPVPLVGREAERDALWGALLDVHAQRAPGLIVVRGPSGVGKSRLAEWVCHRAIEAGAARVLRATFQPLAGRGDGLGGLVARAADLIGLEGRAARGQARRWLGRWLPGADITADELCALAGRREGVFSGGEERQAALVRLLAALACERSLLVWLDDAQHGKEALALVERTLADAPELPVLFVATVVDELLDDDLAARLGALEALRAARAIPLEPLDDMAHDELCARLLGGEAGGLADELRRRTEGNALFAVQVVGDWVARGLLEVKPDGLALKPGVAPELPDELHALWDQRIAAAVGEDGEDGEARLALEIAATLGSTVDLVEWETAIAEARLGEGSLDRGAPGLVDGLVDAVVDALVGVGLARRTDAGFQLAHAMVRGSVERRAREAGRLQRHHACAAAALSALWGTDTPAAAARIGRHLLAAGAPSAALRPLVLAARAAVEEGNVLEAGAILADWDRARSQLGLEDSDERAAAGLVISAQVSLHEGRHDEAHALADRAARAVADPIQRAAALRIQASARLVVGDLDGAAALFARAEEASVRANDPAGVGAALRGLGDVDYWRGDYESAARRYHRVWQILSLHGKKSELAASLWSLGYVEMERGAFDEARGLFLEQRKIARGARDRLSEANAENALGELARRRGDLGEAEARYKTAARLASRSGLSRRWVFRLNLAHLLLLRGDLKAARDVAAELLSSAASKEPLIGSSAWWILAVEAAARHDVAAWDRAAQAAIDIGVSAMVERDLVTVSRRAGEAIAGLDAARAERAFAFSRRKQDALERYGGDRLG